MTYIWMLAVLVLAAASNAPPPLKGRICMGERKSTLTSGKCAATTGAIVSIAPAETERLYLWTSEDQSSAQLGVVPVKATELDLDPASLASIALTIAGERSRGWPADLEVAFRGKEQWVWRIDAKAASKLRKLVVPRGGARLQLKAPRHRTLTRAQIAVTGAVVTLGELRLLPLPAARGVVVDGEGKPIASALVSLPDGSLCSTANEQGAFSCELGEPVAEALIVSSNGFGERELALDQETAQDVDLGRILLTTGRALRVKITRPEAAPGKVSLYLDTPSRYEHSKLKTHPLTEREEEVRFEVAAGTYQILIEGQTPLERLEVPVTVGEEDLFREISVEPYQLVGTFRFGEEALSTGRLGLISPANTWRADLVISEGAFGGTLWQRGRLHAFAGSPETGMGELLESPELGDDPSRWDIHIGKRMIMGHVLDAGTRKPVPNVEFQLTVSHEEGTGHFPVKVDPEGAYTILANRPGTYGLRVTSAGHVPYVREVKVTAEGETQTVDVLLEPGVLQPLDIVSNSGAPIANALVLEGVQADRVNPQFMTNADARGRYELRGRAGETRVLYIVPADGSFAVVRVQIPRSNADVKALPVVVPAGSSSLRVRTTDGDDKPVPAVILVRFNGEFVPAMALRFVTGELPGTALGGEGVLRRLPAGAYEIWALSNLREEEQLILSGGSLRQPVRVGLSGGEQVVTVPAPPRAQGH